MNVMKLMAKKAADVWNERPVTIAFLGDSVTQGCFEIYNKSENEIETVFDKNYAYHNYVAKILSVVFPNVPVNIINAGLSGDFTGHALKRIKQDVISHNPDLTVVCFGLNDSSFGLEGVEKYKNDLKKIFEELRKINSEIIFMTPNMMNTYVSCRITDPYSRQVAEDTMQRQNGGVYEAYVNGAREVCRECNVVVCDCYDKWKRLYDYGVDITELLANRMNHPTREMNWFFANALVETMIYG